MEEVRSVSESRKPSMLALVRVALALLVALSVALSADAAFANGGGNNNTGNSGASGGVTPPAPDSYEVTFSIPAVNEDAIADTATSIFAAYQNVVWLVGGISLGFFTLRRARRLLR